MNQVLTWIETAKQTPSAGEWVAVWDTRKGFFIVAKWAGTHWKAVANNTTKEAGKYWAVIHGPNGEKCGAPSSAYTATKRDSQHS